MHSKHSSDLQCTVGAVVVLGSEPHILIRVPNCAAVGCRLQLASECAVVHEIGSDAGTASSVCALLVARAQVLQSMMKMDLRCGFGAVLALSIEAPLPIRIRILNCAGVGCRLYSVLEFDVIHWVPSDGGTMFSAFFLLAACDGHALHTRVLSQAFAVEKLVPMKAVPCRVNDRRTCLTENASASLIVVQQMDSDGKIWAGLDVDLDDLAP